MTTQLENDTSKAYGLKDTVASFFGSFSNRNRILESSAVHEDNEAEEYDAMVMRYQWLLNLPFVNIICKLGLKGVKVLDIGTGPGHIPVELAKRNAGWEIWAVDMSEDMLEQGRRHAEKAGVADRVHFVQGSATDLPFEAESFDLVVSHFMLHHIDVPELMFNEASRVAKTGGQVIIKDLLRHSEWKTRLLINFSKYFLRYSDEQLNMYRESIDAGLTKSEVREAAARSTLSNPTVKGFRGIDYILSSRKG